MRLMPHLCHTVSYWTIMNLLESNTKVRNCFRDTEPRKPGGQLELSIEYSFFLCVSKPRIFAQNCWQDHASYSQDLTGPVSNLSQNRQFWTQTSSNSYFAVTSQFCRSADIRSAVLAFWFSYKKICVLLLLVCLCFCFDNQLFLVLHKYDWVVLVGSELQWFSKCKKRRENFTSI